MKALLETLCVAVLKAALLVALIIAIGVAIVSCSELGQMSDTWCAEHPAAAEYRCSGHAAK